MNILFMSHYFPPEGNAPASRVSALCKHWVAAGHRVTVITCAPNVPNGVVYAGYRNAWRSEQTVDGIRVIRVWTYLAPNKGTARRIANYLSYMFSATANALFVHRPDVLIATSPQFFCGWAGVLVSWLRRVPFVLEIRDIWPESISAVEAVESKRVLRILEWLEQRMYRAARLIVAVGEGYRQRLIQRGVPAQKIEVIMNGLDSDLFKPRDPDEALKAKWGLTSKFVCSYSGTIGMACGLDIVLRAATRLKAVGRNDISFLLVGDGAVRAELQERALAMGLSNVVFTGRQDKAAMPALLSVSDACLVHLRKTELFTSVMPSKIFEAAGMARPIINGVDGFAADFVGKAGAGICIEPDNDTQLVDAVLKLADSPGLCRQLGNAGHQFVSAHYEREALARDYIRLLRPFESRAAR